jgi:hypothetical protein
VDKIISNPIANYYGKSIFQVRVLLKRFVGIKFSILSFVASSIYIEMVIENNE